MKKFWALVATAGLVMSCYDDSGLIDRIDDLDQRLTTVENLVASLNSQLDQLQELMDGKLFISGVEDKEDGTHVVTFVNTKGEMTTMVIKDGASPNVSVGQTPDGKWYWMVNGDWLLDSEGNKIPVTGERGVTPSMKIENGKWYVSYDYGVTYIECGKATGDDGDAFFKSVVLSEDGKLAYVTLADGTVITLDVYKEFGIAVDVTSALIYSGQTKKFAYVITGGDEKTCLEVLPKGNWQAEVERTDDAHGNIVVTAPNVAEVGKVILLLGDGADKTIMRTLTFVAGELHVSTSSVEVEAAGGNAEVSVTTNVDFEASLDENPSWAHLVQTKSYETRTEVVMVKVDANDLPYARQTTLTLRHEGQVVETVLLYQAKMTYSDDKMVLMVQPLERDKTVYLPVFPVNGKEFYVNWGDGSKVDTLTAGNPSHIYEDVTREYPVQVYGTLRSLSRSSKTGHYSDITEVIQWGNTGIAGLSFEYNEKLRRIPAPKGEELRAVSSCNNMFNKCKSLKEIPSGFMQGLSPKTTNFNYAFTGCESLEKLPEDLFEPFTGSILIMQLYSGCKSLKTVPPFGNVKLANDASLYNQTFKNCESLETLPENLYPASVKDAIRAKMMNSTFSGCKSLKSIPASVWTNVNWDKIERMTNTFMGCESLTSESLEFLKDTKMTYSWTGTFSGCTSLTTLPENEVEIDGQKVSVPLWKRGDDAYKAYFANKSYSYTNCFKDCINLEGYYDKIPQACGGGWDGSTEAPTIEVSATLPENRGYYMIDFNVKGKSVASAYYYLSAKAVVDEVLPKYNNSYSELCEKRGIEIETDYLNAINSTQGLTLGFDSGVPNVEYILIVSGKNMFGQSYAYKVQSTTSVPKGCQEYENFIGEWTVTSDFSVISIKNYDQHPISFDIKIEPCRVDSMYTVYGWGVTKFAQNLPMRMYFEDNKLTAWTGAHHNSVIYEGYPYSDGINYNVALNSFTRFDDGSYGVYMADGERVGEAEYSADGFQMKGVKSKYYAEQGYDVLCYGFDFCLSMGGPGWSKIFIAPEVVRDEYVIKDGDEIYAPYIMGPYTFKKKASSETTSSRTMKLNQKTLKSGKCIPVNYEVK